MRRNKAIRVDPNFEMDMREIATVRVSKRLAEPKQPEMSIREMTHLLRTTESYPKALEELRVKPKRRKR